jgi:putative CRISPR-associated protein (TIGR02619 family)
MVGTFTLSTVGTSLLGHLRRELSRTDLPPMQQALSMLRSVNPKHTVAGAEINSIEHLLNGLRLSTGQTEPPHELAFLVSETPDGRWTGELLESYYRKVRGFGEVRWYELKGLTPDDPARFARIGLRDLVRVSSKLLRDAGNRDMFRVINATGGFKAQISFAGLIGQTLGVAVVYQFETFPVCVEMPPMPVDFDRQVWLVNQDAFMRLSASGHLEEHEFPFEELEPVIRDLLDVIEEEGRRLYALSPILELMHQGFLARRPLGLEAPPPSRKPPKEKLNFVKHELPHSPKGTEQFALTMARSLPWIVEVQNEAFINTARSHLLPRTGTVDLHRVCFSDGQKGVRLRIRTTSDHERHRDYAEQRLAEFCTEW